MASLELMNHVVFVEWAAFSICWDQGCWKEGQSPLRDVLFCACGKLPRIARQNDGSQPTSSRSEQLKMPWRSFKFYRPSQTPANLADSATEQQRTDRCQSGGAVFEQATRQKESLCWHWWWRWPKDLNKTITTSIRSWSSFSLCQKKCQQCPAGLWLCFFFECGHEAVCLTVVPGPTAWSFIFIRSACPSPMLQRLLWLTGGCRAKPPGSMYWNLTSLAALLMN